MSNKTNDETIEPIAPQPILGFEYSELEKICKELFEFKQQARRIESIDSSKVTLSIGLDALEFISVIQKYRYYNAFYRVLDDGFEFFILYSNKEETILYITTMDNGLFDALINWHSWNRTYHDELNKYRNAIAEHRRQQKKEEKGELNPFTAIFYCFIILVGIYVVTEILLILGV